MYKKITFIIILIFSLFLYYVARKYDAVNALKFAFAKDYVPFYEAAADEFWIVGIFICFASWVWVDVVVIKTKQLFWLWIPFLFIIVVTITNTNHEEKLFHFKKANGLWKGGFSLSYVFGIGVIIIAGITLIINYLAFKWYFSKADKLIS